RHHGFTHDPFHDASNAPDLLGMRVLGTWTAAHVREHVPRIKRADLLGAIGLEPDPDAVAFADGDVAAAAAAAVGAPSLTGRACDVTAARAAAIHLCRPHL